MTIYLQKDRLTLTGSAREVKQKLQLLCKERDPSLPLRAVLLQLLSHPEVISFIVHENDFPAETRTTGQRTKLIN